MLSYLLGQLGKDTQCESYTFGHIVHVNIPLYQDCLLNQYNVKSLINMAKGMWTVHHVCQNSEHLHGLVPPIAVITASTHLKRISTVMWLCRIVSSQPQDYQYDQLLTTSEEAWSIARCSVELSSDLCAGSSTFTLAEKP